MATIFGAGETVVQTLCTAVKTHATSTFLAFYLDAVLLATLAQ